MLYQGPCLSIHMDNISSKQASTARRLNCMILLVATEVLGKAIIWHVYVSFPFAFKVHRKQKTAFPPTAPTASPQLLLERT